MRKKVNYHRFIVLFALCIFLAGTEAFAFPLESLLPETQVKELVRSGSIDRERFDLASLGMIPRYGVLEKLLEENRRSVDPNITVESLRLYKKPSGTQAENWTAAERTALYNGIVAISTLKGLEYFSKSRNKMRLLYESSAVVDSPEGKNSRPDPVYRSPPAELSLYVRQKDLTFGDNVYKFSYYSNDSSFIVLQENLSALNYGLVSVVAKNKLKSVVAIFDCGPYLLIYTASLAKASMLPGMKQRAGESISNRANALLGWFTGKADRAFKNYGA